MVMGRGIRLLSVCSWLVTWVAGGGLVLWLSGVLLDGTVVDSVGTYLPNVIYVGG